MNKNDIKRVIARLEPDNKLEQRLADKLGEKFQRRISYKPVAAIAAGLVIVLGAGAFASYQMNSNIKPKLSMKPQTGSTDSLIALLPANKTPEKSALNNQDGNPASPSAPLPANQATGKSALTSQDGNPDSSSTALPADKAPEKSALTSQDSHANNSSALLPEGQADGKSEVIAPKSSADSSTEMPPENKTTLEPRTMVQSTGVDNSKTPVSEGINEQNEGIYVPKVQLPADTKPNAKMMGLIVYQGRIYLQSALQIDPQNAEKLVGEKLGTTKGTITEWSKQDDYAVELASTVGIQDVYTVKGYDTSFRIMTYEKIDGAVYAYFFECLNGITVKTGNDIFGKFKLENNIESVSYEDFDSWNNGIGNYKFLTKMDGFNNFLAALKDSIPHAQEGLANLFDDQSTTGQKFLSLKLKDGSAVQLRLFKDGYVYYSGVNIVFKIDSPAFNSFWDGLE